MKRTTAVLMLLTIMLGILFMSACEVKKEKFTDYSFDYFDTVTSISGYAVTKEDFDLVCDEVFAELEIYHKLFNIYNVYDGINNLATVNAIKDGVHVPVKVDTRIIDMLLFCKDMHEKTDGLVNVAMGSVLSIWHSHRQSGAKDPANATLPELSLLEEAAKHTDISNVIIDRENSTVFLSDPKMLLDVGAIAKGYAVEMVARSLEDKGITGYVLNVGGNVRTLGTHHGGEPWIAGIENPDGSEDEPYYSTVKLESSSLVTSGSYQRYYIVNGKNYNHIIDPSTLFPADRYTSVSIICKSSAMADALSTALFCIGIEDGMRILDSFEGAEAMWVSTSGEISYSQGFRDYTVK